MPERAGDKMKGRPVTGEEFDRLLDVVERVLVEGQNAQRTADVLWQAHAKANSGQSSNTFSNSGQETNKAGEHRETQSGFNSELK